MTANVSAMGRGWGRQLGLGLKVHGDRRQPWGAPKVTVDLTSLHKAGPLKSHTLSKRANLRKCVPQQVSD